MTKEISSEVRDSRALLSLCFFYVFNFHMNSVQIHSVLVCFTQCIKCEHRR